MPVSLLGIRRTGGPVPQKKEQGKIMKKKTWFFKGILGITLVFGLFLSACPTDADSGGGQEYTVTFDAQGGNVNPPVI
jgi:hypothetical protein